MRFSAPGLASSGLVLIVACGGSSHDSGGPTPDGGSTSSSGGSSTSSSGGSSGSGSGGSSSSTSGGGGGSSSGGFGQTGNPDGSCKALAIPGEGQLVDTSNPTTVVGNGTAASCTFDALNAAVSKGGVITFDCGPDPVTIPLTATLTPPVSKGAAPAVAVVIDGGNKVTLDG